MKIFDRRVGAGDCGRGLAWAGSEWLKLSRVLSPQNNGISGAERLKVAFPAKIYDSGRFE
jgi:hypothetical protein